MRLLTLGTRSMRDIRLDKGSAYEHKILGICFMDTPGQEFENDFQLPSAYYGFGYLPLSGLLGCSPYSTPFLGHICCQL